MQIIGVQCVAKSGGVQCEAKANAVDLEEWDYNDF